MATEPRSETVYPEPRSETVNDREVFEKTFPPKDASSRVVEVAFAEKLMIMAQFLLYFWHF